MPRCRPQAHCMGVGSRALLADLSRRRCRKAAWRGCGCSIVDWRYRCSRGRCWQGRGVKLTLRAGHRANGLDRARVPHLRSGNLPALRKRLGCRGLRCHGSAHCRKSCDHLADDARCEEGLRRDGGRAGRFCLGGVNLLSSWRPQIFWGKRRFSCCLVMGLVALALWVRDFPVTRAWILLGAYSGPDGAGESRHCSWPACGMTVVLASVTWRLLKLRDLILSFATFALVFAAVARYATHASSMRSFRLRTTVGLELWMRKSCRLAGVSRRVAVPDLQCNRASGVPAPGRD